MKTVSLREVGAEELALPARVQEALGELVGSAKEGLLAVAWRAYAQDLESAGATQRGLPELGDQSRGRRAAGHARGRPADGVREGRVLLDQLGRPAVHVESA